MYTEIFAAYAGSCLLKLRLSDYGKNWPDSDNFCRLGMLNDKISTAEEFPLQNLKMINVILMAVTCSVTEVIFII